MIAISFKHLKDHFHSYILYKLFLYVSKRVSFNDFTIIWNEAYRAHVEAEWKRLKEAMEAEGLTQPTGIPLESIKRSQVGLGDSRVQMQSGVQAQQTWPRPESIAGKGGKLPN